MIILCDEHLLNSERQMLQGAAILAAVHIQGITSFATATKLVQSTSA